MNIYTVFFGVCRAAFWFFFVVDSSPETLFFFSKKKNSFSDLYDFNYIQQQSNEVKRIPLSFWLKWIIHHHKKKNSKGLSQII